MAEFAKYQFPPSISGFNDPLHPRRKTRSCDQTPPVALDQDQATAAEVAQSFGGFGSNRSACLVSMKPTMAAVSTLQ